jgi:glycosyltransferase involved in cell wall biosynthesis
VQFVFFEYLGTDHTIANFMLGPSARFTNVFRALTNHYGVSVVTIYSNVHSNRLLNFVDFIAVLLSSVLRMTIGSLRNSDGIYTTMGRSWLAGFLVKVVHPSFIWIADANDTGRGEVATEMLRTKKPYEYHALQLFKRTILRKSDFVVGSGYNIDLLVREGFPSKKTIVMQDGANIHRFKHGKSEDIRRRFGLLDKTVILFDGKLLPHYHVEKLIFAFAKMRKKNSDLVLLIVGDGPAMQYLRSVPSSLSLEDSVVLTGLQPYSIMPDIVAAADVCVLPFPTVGLQVWEWLAAGKIVVAVDAENIRKHGLCHMKNCILVDSSEQLAEGIELALRTKDELRYLSSNAVRLAEKLDWKTLVGRIYLAMARKKGRISGTYKHRSRRR